MDIGQDNPAYIEEETKSSKAAGRWSRVKRKLSIPEASNESPTDEGKNKLHLVSIVLQLQKLTKQNDLDLFKDLPEQEARAKRWQRVAESLQKELTVKNSIDEPHEDDEREKVVLQRPEEHERARAWLMVFNVFMINALMDGYQYSCGLLFIAITQEFRATSAEVAWISSIYQMFLCIACLGGSILVKLTSPRIICLLGSVLMSAGVASAFFNVPHLWYLYINMGAVAGIGTGLLLFVSSTILCYWFKERVSLANGISKLGTGVGQFAFPPLINYLIGKMGWRYTCLILGGVLLHCIIFSFLISQSKKLKIVITPSDIAQDPIKIYLCYTAVLAVYAMVSENGMSQSKQPESRLAVIRKVFSETFNIKLFQGYVFSIFFAANMVGFFTLKAPFLYMPPRASSLGLSAMNIGWLVSATGIGSMVGRLSCGWLADTSLFKTRRLLLFVSCWLVCGIATSFNVSISFEMQLVYASIFGISFGSIIMLQPVVVYDQVGLERLPAAFGLLRLGTAAPSLLGTPLLGLLFDYTLDYSILFAVAGSALCLCGLLLLTIYAVQRILEIRNKAELEERNSDKDKRVEDNPC